MGSYPKWCLDNLLAFRAWDAAGRPLLASQGRGRTVARVDEDRRALAREDLRDKLQRSIAAEPANDRGGKLADAVCAPVHFTEVAREAPRNHG